MALIKCKGSEFLVNLAEKVRSGDSDNFESQAAQYYFNNGFNGLKRREENVINSALNYGYSIIRGVVARSLVSHGFYPPIGIHHKNELNEYNLADDFIEPFRPYVDIYVVLNTYKDKLTKQQRTDLVSILHNDCLIDNKKYSLLYAIDYMITSYVKAIKKNDYKLLKLPELILPKKHDYE